MLSFVETKLNEITSIGIDSYEYIHQIIEFINHYGHESIEELNNILTTGTQADAATSYDRRFLFTVYYAASFYYKRYDSLDRLKQLIDTYSSFFSFALLEEEIESWYFRRAGNLKKAFQLDKSLVSKLSIKINAGPYISFASSVSKMLEEEFDQNIADNKYLYWNSKNDMVQDWKKAKQFIQQAISQYALIRPNKKYGKHFAIYGRLIAYNPNLFQMEPSEIDELYQDAMQQLDLAIAYENVNEEDYYKRYEEFRRYQTKIGLLRMKACLHIENQELNKKISEFDCLKKELENTQQELKKSQEEHLAKSLEILSVFTAIIAIVFEGISTSVERKLSEAVILTSLSTVSMTMMISFLSVLLFNSKARIKKGIVGFLISLAILGFIIMYLL